MRNIRLVVLFLVLLLMIFPSCTKQDASDIMDRFIPSCAMGVKEAKEKPVRVKCWTATDTSVYGYDESGIRRSVFVGGDLLELSYGFFRNMWQVTNYTEDRRKPNPEVYIEIRKGEVIYVLAHVRDIKTGHLRSQTKQLTWDEAHSKSTLDTSNDILQCSHVFRFYFRLDEDFFKETETK